MERDSCRDIYRKLDLLINKTIKNSVFTACSIGFSMMNQRGVFRDIYSWGKTDFGSYGKKAVKTTFFDMASLTKPIVTALCIVALIEEEKISLDDTLSCCLGVACPFDKIKIKIVHLLSHSSGLPAHKPYYIKLINYPLAKRNEKIIEWILKEKLCCEPGEKAVYSDLGYILLGYVIEKISGQNLDSYWKRKIIEPLKLEKSLFFLNETNLTQNEYVVTGNCAWSKVKLCGVVHDDNCRSLGGVAGHAGLFGSAEGLLSLCEHLIEQFKGRKKHPSYSSSSLMRFSEKREGSSWALGFDTPTPGLSSSGNYFSQKSIGHLGFTGTSFWIDLQRDIAVIMLTNRVSCGENVEKIRELRPVVHDIIMERLILPRQHKSERGR